VGLSECPPGVVIEFQIHTASGRSITRWHKPRLRSATWVIILFVLIVSGIIFTMDQGFGEQSFCVKLGGDAGESQNNSHTR
jgi:amino acid permease